MSRQFSCIHLFSAMALVACAPDGASDASDCAARTFFADADGDGFGDGDAPVEACEAPADHVEVDGDCDDGSDAVHPGADEHCDGIDEDCDGLVDEDPLDPTTWFLDADADGHGDPDATTEACDAPLDHVADATDCDDDDDTRHPGADELCDAVDQDCDGEIDEDPIDGEVFYADDDGDGHGVPDTTLVACSRPAGFSRSDADCDDAADHIHPDAPEVCANGIDEDCSGDDLVCGFTGTYALSDAAGRWTGQSDDRWPEYLASVGDIDGDGADDLVATVPVTSRGSGHSSYEVPGFGVALYGDSTWPDRTIAGEPQWGREAYTGCMDAVDGAGDLDGDGLGDFIVGASCSNRDAGEVFILYGDTTRPSGTTPTASLTAPGFTGANAWDRVGITVHGAGDLDGDGYDDALWRGYAHAWVLYGSASRVRGTASVTGLPAFDAIDARQGFGADIASGDLDGDGTRDLIIASIDAYTTDGAALVFRGTGSRWTGTTDQEDADLTITGPGQASFSLQTEMLGDVDGDGYADLAVSAQNEHRGSYTYEGAVYVFGGGPDEGSPRATWSVADAVAVIYGDPRDTLGVAVHDPGDIDGDGRGDLLVGTRGTGALLYHGPDLAGSLDRLDAVATFEGTGTAADGAGMGLTSGDFDGDGSIDVAMAGPRAHGGAGRLWLFAGGS